MTRETKETVPR